MSLQVYRSKRRFKETPEPAGKKQHEDGTLQFVIQRHAARHLHYDLRLELDGVLKSWAVPKGPSMDPKDKRLAIQVEDHPLEYGSFEGTIPPGHYGAGEVTIWDHGTYAVEGPSSKKEQEKLIRQQLEQGELKFTFFSEKLHGKFVLVRLNTDPTGKQWLLIKKKEEEALVLRQAIPGKKEPQKGTKAAMPHPIKPMLAYLTEAPFDNKEWLFEIKWDGYRAIAEITPTSVALYSRNFISFKEKFPTIVASLQKFKETIIFDGEIVMLDKEGRSQFQLLQNYLQSDVREGQLKYCVFDLLYYQGRDLRALPLIERKQVLQEILQKAALPDILYSDHIEEKGTAFFKEASEQNIEGMMAKERHSPYLSSRSRSWLKIKVHQRQEVVIAGFTPPKGSRKKIGALILGVYDKGNLIFVGHVGTGFNERSLNEIYELLKPLITKECPFTLVPTTKPHPIWVKPKLVCEVSFQEWTKENIMRQPVFHGLRPDKEAKSVTREKTIKTKSKPSDPPKKASKKSKVLEEIVTHPEKVFWPHEGFTKENLLEYYEKIAPVILPHLKDRPIVLHRYPEGIEGPDFYQKEAPAFIPNWLSTAKVKQTKKDIRYLLIDNVKDLLYVVNLASIEIHPFLSRYPKVDFPDFLVLDIDPNALPFSAAVEVALEAHKVLKKLQIDHYCKTSGKRGLHIFLPLHGQYPYEPVENLAKLLAYYIHLQLPDITSVVRDPAKRQKKVYIDYLQNGRTKTVVAPYSVRPVEGATVSAPLEWKEVKKGLDPHDFTIQTMAERVKKKGDLFKPVLGPAVNIQALLQKLENH